MTELRPELDAAVAPALVAVLEESRQFGFLGPGPVDAHLEHALDFAVIVKSLAPARALDLGSGGGLPGLVVLAALPELQMVLLDAHGRRTAFLERAVAQLGWSARVRVITARAEDAARDPDLRHGFEVVVARSFGPPAATAECAAPLLAIGGRLVVSEPPADHAIDRWPADGLAELALVRDDPLALGARALDHRFAVLRSVARCAERYPRRVGMPAKRPLFVSQET